VQPLVHNLPPSTLVHVRGLSGAVVIAMNPPSRGSHQEAILLNDRESIVMVLSRLEEGIICCEGRRQAILREDKRQGPLLSRPWGGQKCSVGNEAKAISSE